MKRVNSVLGYGWLIACCVLLAGCGASRIVLDTSFPRPLVEPVPLRVGVYYSDAFRHYEKNTELERAEREEKSTEPNWIIAIGEAQQRLFNTLLSAMFMQSVTLERLPDENAGAAVDLVLVPTLEDFQYSVPAVTKINVFEIWLRYNLQLRDGNGNLIADWIMSAYGKTPTRFLKSQEQALLQAAQVAMRDAGASFVLGFSEVPEVKDWLASRLDRTDNNRTRPVQPALDARNGGADE